MPHANRDDRLAYAKRWKQANHEKYMAGVRAANIRKTAQLQEYLNKVKAKGFCVKCGEATDCCLDFHHRNPAEKSFGISNGPSRKIGLKRFKEEIAKCDILCANCHRKVHAGVV